MPETATAPSHQELNNSTESTLLEEWASKNQNNNWSAKTSETAISQKINSLCQQWSWDKAAASTELSSTTCTTTTWWCTQATSLSKCLTARSDHLASTATQTISDPQTPQTEAAWNSDSAKLTIHSETSSSKSLTITITASLKNQHMTQMSHLQTDQPHLPAQVIESHKKLSSKLKTHLIWIKLSTMKTNFLDYYKKSISTQLARED